MPLEVTFAPTRLNIHDAPAVIERARALGAFRLNTGRLMRIGTAARLWDRLEPDAAQYREFLRVLEGHAAILEGELELCYVPFSMADGLRASLQEPPATLLVLPNGFGQGCGGASADLCRLASGFAAAGMDRLLRRLAE